MPNHTLVAVYGTAAQAAAAVNDLQAAHVLPDAISQHTKTLTASGTTHSPPHEQGFWASHFGSEHDTSVYDRSVEEGASVLTVRVPDDGVDRVGPGSGYVQKVVTSCGDADFGLRHWRLFPIPLKMRTSLTAIGGAISGHPTELWAA